MTELEKIKLRVDEWLSAQIDITLADIQGVTNAQMDAWNTCWACYVKDNCYNDGSQQISGQHPPRKPPI